MIMNDWIVEFPTFEEDLMNNRMIYLNKKGIEEVINIINNKNNKIERLNNIIKEVREYMKSEKFWYSQVKAEKDILEILNKESKDNEL